MPRIWECRPDTRDSFRKLRSIDESSGFGVAYLVANLLRMKTRIDRHNTQAGFEAGEHRLQKLSAVALEDGEATALIALWWVIITFTPRL